MIIILQSKSKTLLKSEKFLPFLDCREINIDYMANDIGSLTNVDSWEKCSEECTKKSGCFAWSYITDKHSTTAWRRRCHFKSSSWKNGRTAAANIVSGEKSCKAREFFCEAFLTLTLDTLVMLG